MRSGTSGQKKAKKQNQKKKGK